MHKLRITICAYDSTDNIDGPTSWMKRLLPYLRDNGIDTRIIFFAAHTKKLPAYLYFINLGFECKLIYWELFNEEKIIAILEDIKQYPPDIFIPNFFPTACYAAKWVKQSGIPTVCILHNDDDYHLKLMEVFALGKEENKISAIVGVSKLLTEIIKNNGATNIKVESLPYGAPVPQYYSSLSNDGPLRLVYMGRIKENQKRISEVTKAFCRVTKEIPGTECTLYGSGKDLKNVLEILKTEGNGLPIVYGGNLETNVVQGKLINNHVFVLLSDYEGLPISLMEAMACGLVPVCLNIRSGISELITNGETGLLVNDRNDDFVNAIRNLKSDKNNWRRLSLAARNKIINDFSEDICNKRWMDFLIKLSKDKKEGIQLIIPDKKELRSLFYPVEFKVASNPAPSPIVVPLYKLKTFVGRIKKIFIQIYL